MGSVESRRKQIPVSVFSLQSTKCTINILFIMLVIKNSAIVSMRQTKLLVCLSHSFSFLKRETKTLLNTYLGSELTMDIASAVIFFWLWP